MHAKLVLAIFVTATLLVSYAPQPTDLDAVQGRDQLLLEQGDLSTNTVGLQRIVNNPGPGADGVITATLKPGLQSNENFAVEFQLSGTSTYRATGKDYEVYVRHANDHVAEVKATIDDGGVFTATFHGADSNAGATEAVIELRIRFLASNTVAEKDEFVQVDVSYDLTSDYKEESASAGTATVTMGTTPGSPDDLDGDGILNAEDNCPLHPNAAQTDTDGDATKPYDQQAANEGGDPCDNDDQDGPKGDKDADGVANEDDNCPAVSNPSPQSDPDGDGFGNACDDDDDGDGVDDHGPDGLPGGGDDDNCPVTANPRVDHDNDANTPDEQPDFDGDGAGDACDPDDDNDSYPDVDEDLNGNGIVEKGESDPKDDKSTPLDRDGDGASNDDEIAFGSDPDDASSGPADTDGDGVKNKGADDIAGNADDDNCPATPNTNQNDLDGDGLGDACDSDADGDGYTNVVCKGTGKARDTNDLDPAPTTFDSDCDGVADWANDAKTAAKDNCRFHANPDQANLDGPSSTTAVVTDLMGDACDDDDDGDGIKQGDDSDDRDPATDWDGDKVPDGRVTVGGNTGPDQCQGAPDQANLNPGTGAGKNNIPDACDVDQDGDGVADKTGLNKVKINKASPPRFARDYAPLAVTDGGDNCPRLANVDQADTDANKLGDACQDDDDGDGVPDATDAFPNNPLEWADTDGDGVGDNSDICADADDGIDSDGDGTPDGCDGIDNNLDEQGLETLATTMATQGSKALKGSTKVVDGIRTTTLTYSPPVGAQHAVLYRSDSPFVTVATQAASVGKFSDQFGQIDSRYVVTFTFITGGTEYGRIDPATEAGQQQLEAIASAGGYYKLVDRPAARVVDDVRDIPAITTANGGGSPLEVTYKVIVYDGDENPVRSKLFTTTIDPHTARDVDVAGIETSNAASYKVFAIDTEGEHLVMSGTINQTPYSDPSELIWLIAGAVLLAGIVFLAIAGIISYQRSNPTS